MRKTDMKIIYCALLLINCCKVHSTEAPLTLTPVATESLTTMKDLINFMKEEAAFEKRDIEEGVMHVGIADVKETLLAKVVELRASKPQCVRDTEAVANGIVSEVGVYVKKCFAMIEEKLNSASNLADNAKTISDVDKLVTSVSEYYDNKQSQLTKCTRPAAKVMLARLQKEEENIDNCVKTGTDSTPSSISTDSTVTTPEGNKPEENKPPESEIKLPSSTIRIYYILPPRPCRPRRPRRRPRPVYYYYYLY